MPVIPALWGRGKELGVHSHSQLYGKFEDWTVWDTQTLYQEASTQSPLRYILCSSPFESIFTRPLLVLWTCLLSVHSDHSFTGFMLLLSTVGLQSFTTAHFNRAFCVSTLYTSMSIGFLAFINNKSSELKAL